MATTQKVILTWSSGKDSALALHELQQAGRYEVLALLTIVTEGYDRISMHGVRRCLLEQQADALALPLEQVVISQRSSNEEYEANMAALLSQYKGEGVREVAFGDIFLRDVRDYREANLARIGMEAIFPLWGRSTALLARRFINLGFKAVTTCVDSHFLGKQFVGRAFDEAFLAELPEAVDPCGENGEFHSFVYEGPIFDHPMPVKLGDIVLREDRFHYCDVMPAG